MKSIFEMNEEEIRLGKKRNFNEFGDLRDGQVSLYPFEERFNLPSIAIDVGNDCNCLDS